MIPIGITSCGSSESEEPLPSGNTLQGVWMSYKVSSGGSASAFDDVKWMVFDATGQIIDDLPQHGLYAITSEELKKYTTGTYTVHGKSVQADTPYDQYTFDWTDSNTLTQKNSAYAYHRCLVKDNLRLQGSWTSFETTTDPWLDQPGVRQVLTLNNDGGFTDRGLFVSNTNFPDKDPNDKPGTGIYLVKDYTLLLNYADGHTKALSFTGAVGLDPSINNKVLYLGGNPVYKR
jgi:hypothetical protein